MLGIESKPVATAGWKRTVLFLFSLLIFISVPAASATFPAEYVLFAPSTYLEVIDRSGFYQNYPHLILDFIGSGGDLFVPGFGNAILMFLQEKKADAVMRFLFPESWVRDQASTLTGQFWDYYNFTSPRLDLGLDLVPVKTRLSSGEGTNWIAGVISTWPDCSVTYVLAITASLIQGKNGTLAQCKPPAALQNAFISAVQVGLTAVARPLPDRIRLLPVQTVAAGGAYNTLRYGLRFAPVGLLMVFIAGVVLLNGSWRRAFAWAALPLYAGGLVAALGAVLIYLLAGWALPIPAQLFPAPAVELYTLFRLVLFLVIERFLAWTALVGLSAAGIGLTLRLLHLNLMDEMVMSE